MNALRATALAVALIALGVIGARPSWRVGTPARDAVLITPGSDARGARRLADSLDGAPILASVGAVLQRRATIRRLHVVGWGLDVDDWNRLESLPVSFHPAPLPRGITRAVWSPLAVLGDQLTVDGTVTGAAGGSKIELLDPTDVVDSTRIDSSDGSFHLAARPKAIGSVSYVIRAARLPAETLGVAVVPPPAWRVLILESSPRSETKTLRDWLGARHGVVAVRSAISRHLVHREFLNRDSIPLDVLSGALLSQFDVVVIDGRTLASLGPLERQSLRRAVEVDGLGVLVVPDTVISDGFFFDFQLQQVASLDERLVRPVWEAGGGRAPEPGAVVPAAAYTLANRFGTENLVRDGPGNVLAQVAPRGAGRVALSLVTGSARWRRAGLADSYSAYWSRLLGAVANANGNSVTWSIATPGPWIEQRAIAIEAVTDRTPPAAFALITDPGGALDTVYLARDRLSGRWRGLYWPRSPGWYRIAGSGTSFYVQTAFTWTGVQATEHRSASMRHGVAAAAEAHGASATAPARERPAPLGWAFACFVLASAYLWSGRRRRAPS